MHYVLQIEKKYFLSAVGRIENSVHYVAKFSSQQLIRPCSVRTRRRSKHRTLIFYVRDSVESIMAKTYFFPIFHSFERVYLNPFRNTGTTINYSIVLICRVYSKLQFSHRYYFVAVCFARVEENSENHFTVRLSASSIGTPLLVAALSCNGLRKPINQVPQNTPNLRQANGPVVRAITESELFPKFLYNLIGTRSGGLHDVRK